MFATIINILFAIWSFGATSGPNHSHSRIWHTKHLHQINATRARKLSHRSPAKKSTLHF